MKVIIIEDEILSAKRLAKMAIEVMPEIEITAMLESVSEALLWFRHHPAPDLIFLDIQLNDGTGFDIIKELKDYPQIIFTTAYEKYALDAFKFNSIDYLLKPIDLTELQSAINKLKYVRQYKTDDFQERINALEQHLTSSYRDRFLVKIGPQFKSIPTDSIAYFYHNEGTSYIQVKQQAIPIDHPLDQLMEELDPKTFFRINRQFIVHIKSIQGIHSYFNSRLLLTLSPQFKDDVIVSRERVLNFKVWAGM